MIKIFFGLVLQIFFLNLSGLVISFDFIGYILIFLGMKEFLDYSKNFKKIQPIVLGMVVFSVLNLFVNMLSLFNTLPLAIIDDIGRLAVIYFIIMGFAELEQNLKVNLYHFRLSFIFKLQAVTCVTYYLCLFLGSDTLTSLFSMLASILGIISLIFFYKAYKNHRYLNR